MKKFFMTKFKLLLTVILALTMAFSLLSSVACKDKKDDDKSSDTTTTQTIKERTDSKTLKNGDFEFGTANTALTSFPVQSPNNWTRSTTSYADTSAPGSSYTSGIIDTREVKYEYDDEGYLKLKDGEPVKALDEDGKEISVFEQIAKNKDKQFIKVYKTDASGELELDEDGNKIFDHYYNPRTPSYYGFTDYTNEDEALTGGGKILMINNYNSAKEGLGTAQYYSYSAGGLSILPGQTGKLELWLMTKDLVADVDEEMDFGAWIEISTTLGSISDIPATRVKNINTEGEWTKFTFYIEGSNFAQTTLSLKVGLGLGNKSNEQEYVQGYTFVDDVYFSIIDEEEIIPTADFESALYNGTSLISKNEKETHELLFKSKFNKDYYTNATYDYPTTGSEYVYLDDTFQPNDNYTSVVTTINCTKAEYPISSTDLSSGATVTELDNFIGGTGVNEAGSSSVGWKSFSELNLNNPFSKTDILHFEYTKEANIAYETSTFPVAGNQNLMISFWVKTDLNPAVSGLNVYLLDKGTNMTNLKPTEVAIKEAFITTEGDNEEYDDWTKLSVIVSNNFKLNETDDDSNIATRYFSIKLVLGPTSKTDNIHAFPKGNAYLANVSALLLDKNDDIDEVASIEKTTSTPVERVLQADLANTTTKTEKTDSYTFSYSEYVDDITTGVVDVAKYKGLVGNHKSVGGDKTQYSQENTVAGLFNSEHLTTYISNGLFGNYNDTNEITHWINSVDKGDNKYLQPLMIYNKADGISYGYVGEQTTINSNTTALVSLKVKIFGNSTAYIYLSNADDKNEFSILGVRAEHKNLGDGITQVVNGDYLLTLTANDINNVTGGNGYATVTFLVSAGNENINFRLEMWNGPRVYDETVAAADDRKAGIVLFDGYSFTSGVSLETQLIKLKSKYSNKLTNVASDTYDYSYQTAEESKQIFTRLPSKVLTDANPDGVTRYYTESDTNNTKTAYMSSKFFVVSDLTSINVTNEIDERTVEDTSDNEESTTTTETDEPTSYSPLLYFTSLAVSIVLILALLAIVVKYIVTAIKKKKAKSQSYYDKDLREIAVENIKAKAKEAKFKEEYDYDNMEANIIEEPTEDEALQEESTEEAVEETAEETEETLEATEETTEVNEAEEPSKE